MESVAVQVIPFESDFQLEWRLLDDDHRVVKASDVCKVLGWNEDQASRKVKDVFPEYRFQSSFGEASRPSWYLYEPGFFQLCFMSNTRSAINLQKFVFELLPKLFRGEVALVSTSSENLPALLQSLMPNTDALTIAALQRRDRDVSNIYTMHFVHSILPYSANFKKHGDRAKEYAVLNACTRTLIYGHDYYFDDEQECWMLTHAGLEYLIAFARPTAAIDLSVFGNSHVVLNMIRFLESDQFPQPTNSYAPRVKMEPSALMKAGQSSKWYGISQIGLEFFASVWQGQNYACWNEFRQLCSSLDTGRYVRYVRNEPKICKMDQNDLFRQLANRVWQIEKHPEYSELWTLRSGLPQLPSR